MIEIWQYSSEIYKVIAQRDNAIRECNNAIAALQFQESTMNGGALGCGSQRGTKRINHHSNHHAKNAQSTHNTRELHTTDVFPITAISANEVKSHLLKRSKVNKGILAKLAKKAKKVGEELNRHVTTDGSKGEWESQDLSCINQINFDESTMPIPVCTCTGVARQCHKWGNGGWQSSGCTTSLFVYPLPQIPNKWHERTGGRKMSRSVFGRLITRVAAAGHVL